MNGEQSLFIDAIGDWVLLVLHEENKTEWCPEEEIRDYERVLKCIVILHIASFIFSAHFFGIAKDDVFLAHCSL